MALDNPVLQALAQYWRDHPDKSTYNWARRNWELIEAAVATDVSREALVQLPFGIKPISALCTFLEVAGLLEPVVINVDRFMVRVRMIVADLERRDALLLEEYARMILVRRAQQRAESGLVCDARLSPQGQVIVALARASRRAVADSSGARSLATMNQADFFTPKLKKKRKSAAKTSTSTSLCDKLPRGDLRVLCAFVRWHNQQRSTRLTLPKRDEIAAAPSPKVRITDDDLARLHQRAHTDEWPVSVRLAALLIILYSQRTAKIAALHVAQLRDDCREIRFADVWLRMPDPLPDFFRQQLASRRNPQSPWVFPSRDVPDDRRPITRLTLLQNLSKAGFPTSRVKGGAIVALLRAVEYPLLARILGMSVGSAAAWAQNIGSPSDDQYVAMRRKQDGQQPGTVTIADRVYGEYSGREVTGELGPMSPPKPQAPLPGDRFENEFRVRRVSVAKGRPESPPSAV